MAYNKGLFFSHTEPLVAAEATNRNVSGCHDERKKRTKRGPHWLLQLLLGRKTHHLCSRVLWPQNSCRSLRHRANSRRQRREKELWGSRGNTGGSAPLRKISSPKLLLISDWSPLSAKDTNQCPLAESMTPWMPSEKTTGSRNLLRGTLSFPQDRRWGLKPLLPQSERKRHKTGGCSDLQGAATLNLPLGKDLQESLAGPPALPNACFSAAQTLPGPGHFLLHHVLQCSLLLLHSDIREKFLAKS